MDFKSKGPNLLQRINMRKKLLIRILQSKDMKRPYKQSKKNHL